MASRRGVIHPIVALPDGHPLVGTSGARLEQIVDEPLIAFASENDEWAADLLRDIAPERLRKASSLLGDLALVSAGAGVAVVPSVLQCVAMPGVSYVPLEGVAGKFVAVAVRRGEPAPAVHELLRMVMVDPGLVLT